MADSTTRRERFRRRIAAATTLALPTLWLATGGAVPAQASTQTLNPSGGVTSTDGLKIAYDGGSFQVYRDNSQQFYGGTNPSTEFYLARPGSSGVRLTSANPDATLAGGGTELTDTLTGTLGGVTYSLAIQIEYVQPGRVMRIQAALDSSGGTPAPQTIVYWGNDSYLGGSDYGYAYTADRSGKREVGVSAAQGGAGATLWSRHSSGPEWTGYFAGPYTQYFNAPGTGAEYSGISDSRTDNGFGWSSQVDPSTDPTFDFYLGFGDAITGGDVYPPSIPGNPAATQDPDTGDVTVTWDEPATDGGAPVETYMAEVLDNDGDVVGRCGAAAPTRTCVVPALPRAAYTAEVVANNAAGASGSVEPPADTDSDGTPDNSDAFPNNPDETTDTDSDGVGDNTDNCRTDANPNQNDSDTDDIGDICDADRDGDGTSNDSDAFPNNPDETTDTDSDGTGDNTDAFPNNPDETTDTDSDGTGDNTDAFPNNPNESTDSDSDGVGDGADNCPSAVNADQGNSDRDGDGNACDADDDNDGVPDSRDAFPTDPAKSSRGTDTDRDGTPDAQDRDDDNDGRADSADDFPADADRWQLPAPGGVTVAPQSRTRTIIAWTQVSGATGYRVTVNGRTVCRTSTTTCDLRSALGRNARVRVVAVGKAGDSGAGTGRYVRPGSAITLGTVHFGPDSTALTRKARAQLRSMARELADYGVDRLVLNGHTARIDSGGDPRLRQALSRQRALAVRDYLRDQLRRAGAGGVTIEIRAKGGNHPVADNGTESGRADNRRAEILLR